MLLRCRVDVVLRCCVLLFRVVGVLCCCVVNVFLLLVWFIVLCSPYVRFSVCVLARSFVWSYVCVFSLLLL